MTARLYDEMEVRKALRRSVNAAGIFDFAKANKLSPVYVKGVCTGDLVPGERLLTAGWVAVMTALLKCDAACRVLKTR